jgi:hypothetical protein
MGMWDVIDEAKLTSDAQMVDFQNIPDTYKDLCVIASVRDSHNTTATSTLILEINANYANNYPWGRYYYNSGSSGAGGGGNGTVNAPIGVMAKDGNSTGLFSPTYLYIHNYTDSSHYKHYSSWSGHQGAVNTNNYTMTEMRWGSWKQDAAITRLKFLSEQYVNNKNLKTGSWITLYGINDS